MPFIGNAATAAKLGKNGLGLAEASAKGAGKADFVADAKGTIVPTNRDRLQKGFDSAGFPAKPADKDGTIYTLPDGTTVRVMEPSGQAPLRASFDKNNSPISPFTGKPVHPPKGLTKPERQDYVRSRTHVELGE